MSDLKKIWSLSELSTYIHIILCRCSVEIESLLMLITHLIIILTSMHANSRRK